VQAFLNNFGFGGKPCCLLSFVNIKMIQKFYLNSNWRKKFCSYLTDWIFKLLFIAIFHINQNRKPIIGETYFFPVSKKTKPDKHKTFSIKALAPKMIEKVALEVLVETSTMKFLSPAKIICKAAILSRSPIHRKISTRIWFFK